MDRGAWKKPVVLEMYGRPGIIQVGDTLDAALLLLRGWYSRRTDAHMTAVLTCRDVLKGRAQPGLARAAFIDAVLDAGYHILPETFLDERWGPMAVIDNDSDSAIKKPDAVAINRNPEPTLAPSRRHTPTSSSLEHSRIPELLAQLGETLGLIAIEVLKSIAGLMNIDVRRRPDRQLH